MDTCGASLCVVHRYEESVGGLPWLNDAPLTSSSINLSSNADLNEPSPLIGCRIWTLTWKFEDALSDSVAFNCRQMALVDDAFGVLGSWTGSTSLGGSAGVSADVMPCVELAWIAFFSSVFFFFFFCIFGNLVSYRRNLVLVEISVVGTHTGTTAGHGVEYERASGDLLACDCFFTPPWHRHRLLLLCWLLLLTGYPRCRFYPPRRVCRFLLWLLPLFDCSI